MVQTMHGFNSRSPNGLRLARRLDKTRNSLFQFTQPKWAATVCWRCQSQKLLRFNSRSPNGLRPNRLIVSPKNDVSIHAAQAGCDRGGATFGDFRPGFNSRSPSGLRRLLQRYNKKEILSKDKSRKSLSGIILDEEAKAVELELTDNQPLRNSNKIMFTWDSQPKTFV